MRYLVVGTQGAASVDIFHRRIKRWAFGDSPKCMTSAWVEDLTWKPADDQSYYHNTRSQTLDIVKRVAEGRPPMTPARDAYETMRLVCAAEQSADSGALVSLAAINPP